MTDVLVIGGGIIGLSIAIALSQKGANVDADVAQHGRRQECLHPKQNA
jgi:glycine/D-amino acid oxidase-like deaminating enzyme